MLIDYQSGNHSYLRQTQLRTINSINPFLGLFNFTEQCSKSSDGHFDIYFTCYLER